MPDFDQTISTYGAAWQEKNPDRRLDLLTACFAEHGRYVDPTADITGRANLSAHIGRVLEETRGLVEITSEPNTHHDVVHFRWHMVAPDGSVLVTGHDFARLDDAAQILHLSGFFGDPALLDQP